MPATLKAGDRVERQGFRGVVRYIGQVQGRGEDVQWVGIEWDNASRGKHDGVVDGVRYFHCEHPTGGSLIKASKLGSGGRRTLMSAIAERHDLGPSLQDNVPGLPMVVGGGKTELLGGDEANARKQRLEQVTTISVSCMGVCCVGNGAELAKQLQSLRHLSLAKSLLSDMATAAEIVLLLEGLHTLDLSDNRFYTTGALLPDSDSTQIDGSPPSRSRLKTLILNKCSVDWASVLSLCSLCPDLEELRIHRAGLTPAVLEATSSKVVHASLRKARLLDLDGNMLTWASVVDTFGPLPHLRELFLSNNEVDVITLATAIVDATAPHISTFAQVERLSLHSNPIRDWRSICELSALPALKSLTARDTTIATAVDSNHASTTYRDGVVARLAHISVLDGSPIPPDERIYAEKQYLRMCFAQLHNGGSPDTVAAEHPRFDELAREYGEVIPTGRQKHQQGRDTSLRKNLAADMVYLKVVPDSRFRNTTTEKLDLALPTTMPVGKLYGLVGRALGEICGRQVRTLRIERNNSGTEAQAELEDETRDLRHYGIEPGDQVTIRAFGV